MNRKILPVLLAGGSGKRLENYLSDKLPKQFSCYFGKETLFQKTLLRFSNKKIFESPIIITNEQYRFIVRNQAAEIGIVCNQIICEPTSKNTAASCIVASIYTEKVIGEKLLLITPTDHYIESFSINRDLVKEINNLDGNILLLGAKALYKSSQYGYILSNSKNNFEKKSTLAKVLLFVEKPKKSIINKYFGSSNFFWNSGIFIFNNKIQNSYFKKSCKSLFLNCKNALQKSKHDLFFLKLGQIDFKKIRLRQSFDQAYISKITKRLLVLGLSSKWVDLGTPESINRSRAFFKFTPNLDQSEVIHRPWGTYKIIEKSKAYIIKEIIIFSKQSISLQFHKHRSEHWTVTDGVANVQIAQKKLRLKKYQSTFVPAMTKHKITNKTLKPVKIIEIQQGSVLSEDDIIRLEDPYKKIR